MRIAVLLVSGAGQVEFIGCRSVDFVQFLFRKWSFSIADRQYREWSAMGFPHQCDFYDEVEGGL